MPGPGMEWVGEEEIKEVMEVLKSGYLYRYGVMVGDRIDPRFKGKVLQCEKEITALMQVKYGVALNSGTSALLTALAGLGIGPGDEVIVPGFTFIASIAAIVYARAVPVLAEIDETFNLDPADVEAKITPHTKGIMVVHMMGNPARLNELKAIADKHKIFLIEDCAQAFGATYHGRPVGSIGAVAGCSFNVYKTITSGDGGITVTNDEQVYKRCFAFHDQGHFPLRQGVEIGARPFFGLDFRFTEVQAAILIAQLRKLPRMLHHLRTNKKRYKSLISGIPGLKFRVLPDPEGEIATMLSVILPTAEIAEKMAKELGTKVVSQAGWHVYNNMEQLLEQRTVTSVQCPFVCAKLHGGSQKEVKYWKGMLPQTDAILGRALNISIGVRDPGLCSGFGITIHEGLADVEKSAAAFRKIAEKYLK
jgi:dTDP-4-amino-4,6-dideoxygalactose transaminase